MENEKDKKKIVGKKPKSILSKRPRILPRISSRSRWHPSRPSPPQSHSKQTIWPKGPPKTEIPHWSGKVWTEPQKPPRQAKAVRYEVDTAKLLQELKEGNKEALEQLIEKIQKESEDKKTDEVEAEETKVKEDIEPEEGEAKENNETDEALDTEKDTDKQETDTTRTEANDNENTKQENAQEVNSEPIAQEQTIEAEPEASEPIMDETTRIADDPAFWEEVENEVMENPEQIEPIEEESIADEGEPVY